MPEIYYCLPCFLNRTYRSNALSHCILWRPDDTAPSQIWYDNPRGQVQVSDKMRWGLFVEGLLRCQIGYLAVNSEGVDSFLRRLREVSRSHAVDSPLDSAVEKEDSTTVLMAVQL